MSTKLLPAQINIDNKTYYHSKCNVYQIIVYTHLAQAVRAVADLKKRFDKSALQSEKDIVLKGLGYIDFLMSRMDAFATLTEIPHNLYELHTPEELK